MGARNREAVLFGHLRGPHDGIDTVAARVGAGDSDLHARLLFAAEASGAPGRCTCLARERLVYCCAHADVAQLVEHNLAKVGVAGSNPVVRSKRKCR